MIRQPKIEKRVELYSLDAETLNGYTTAKRHRLAREYFEMMLADLSFGKGEIISRRRDSYVVDRRQYIATVMSNVGFSCVSIGLAMSRDSTSIHHLLKKRKKEFDYIDIIDNK